MKTLGNIAITTALALLVVTLAKPDFANRMTDKVLGALVPSSPVETTSGILPSRMVTYLQSIRSGSTKSATEVSDTALSTNNIIDATNAERIAAGLPPLIINPLLIESATIKTNDMIVKQYFEHVSPSGVGVSDLGQEVGYDYVVMGENLALGNFIDGNDVVAAWMKSPGHRANILNPSYQEIGVYAAKAVYQGHDVWFAVQHFGTARTACPVISATLKVAIDSINSDLKARQAQIANEKAILESPDRPEGEAYRDQVTEFNKLVAEYNTALVVSQEKIKMYNAQVAAFNACLANYQPR